MTFAQRWRRFWSRANYVPRNDVYFTRLRAAAPTVTREETAKLERKWRQPVDFDQLPV